MDSVMSNLPLEITEQILLRVPVRLLLRLNTVCKQWRSLISDPIFVRNHLNHSLLDEGNLRHRVVKMNWRSTVSSQPIDYQQLHLTHFELSLPSIKSPNRVFGSCNGLLLIGNLDFDEYLLWNPLFREKFKYLPPRISSSSRRTVFVGLGYVSSIDDYKVVVLSTKILSSSECSRELQIEIYSLKTDSWRTLPITIPYTYVFDCLLGSSAHVQGSLHWMGSYYDLIISFDLTTEEYKITETPRDYDDLEPKQPFALVEIGGRLCAYQSTRYIPRALIWMWKKGRWRKLVAIPTEGRKYIQCLRAVSNTELLLNMFDAPYPDNKELCTKFVIWDAENKTLRDIPSAGILTFGFVVHMVETIVSPIIGDGGKL